MMTFLLRSRVLFCMSDILFPDLLVIQIGFPMGAIVLGFPWLIQVRISYGRHRPPSRISMDDQGKDFS